MITWQNIGLVLIAALLLFFTCKAIIGSYFKAKEGFVNKLVDKLKGASNGKRE
jgi:hypothetical protein